MDKLITEQRMEHLREDSFWYDGLIAQMGKFRLYAVGDIRVVFPSGIEKSDGRAVEYANDLGYIDNNLYPNDFDSDIEGVKWINNNWFEVGWIEKNKDGKEIMEFDIGQVEHDYPSAIFMLESYYKEEKVK